MFTSKTPYEKTYLIEDPKFLNFIPGNRKVNEKTVKDLMKAFERNEWIPTIYITKDGYVVDGQHRLTAFRRVKAKKPNLQCVLRVTVINSDESPLRIALKFNSKRKNWVTKDYLNAYIADEVPGYLQLRDFLKSYPEFEIRSAIQLIKGVYSTSQFQDGHLSISDAEYIAANNRAAALYKVAKAIKDDIVYRRDVIIAFYNIYKEIRNIDTFCKKLQKSFVIPSSERARDWYEAYKAVLD